MLQPFLLTALWPRLPDGGDGKCVEGSSDARWSRLVLMAWPRFTGSRRNRIHVTGAGWPVPLFPLVIHRPVSLLPLQLVLPEYSIHSLFCIMFLCAQEYFHCPADSSELAYDPPVVMNADTLSYCQKEAWCKLAFYLLSFFYYLYWSKSFCVKEWEGQKVLLEASLADRNILWATQ
ncbi:hypothetical protein J1605_015605 [Eschrichtius robustus]|uniref:Uncharacterized protein n=1 Tax=Eschrichtius robustus TaxID=9764 RepID=A0AB34GAB8_ESCRO|nr:hypothetical protein J1605_015605 [Eschrichtius robustus]